MNLSQSAVSRQVSALERDLQTPLFHRHARGLMLTEQGEDLFRTVGDVIAKLDATRSRLTDSRERPTGELRITTNLGFGTGWLMPRLKGFLDSYPDVKIKLMLTDIPALYRAVIDGLGIATLPDYLVDQRSDLVVLMPQVVGPELDVFFVYAEEMKHVARVQVFRDYLVEAARRWRA